MQPAAASKPLGKLDRIALIAPAFRGPHLPQRGARTAGTRQPGHVAHRLLIRPAQHAGLGWAGADAKHAPSGTAAPARRDGSSMPMWSISGRIAAAT